MRPRKRTFIRTDIWREGKYIDLWSVPHFLSGIVLGLLLVFSPLSLIPALLLALVLLVAYELFEIIARIEETAWNRALDVVVGMASLTPTVFIAPALSDAQLVGVFVVIGSADLVLSFLGWHASHKAAVLEEKFRREYERERARIRLRRDSMRLGWRERSARWRARKHHSVGNSRDGTKAEDGL